MNLTPLGDRIIVRRIVATKSTVSGIILPESNADKPDQATVLAVGTGKEFVDGTSRPLRVSIGETVLFNPHAGQSVKVDGESYLILREDEIFAVIK